jgi:hypothetical protein
MGHVANKVKDLAIGVCRIKPWCDKEKGEDGG